MIEKRRKTMKVKPLHDWAVIRPSESAEKTAGGLFIPDTAKDKPQEGLVEAIGPGALEEEEKRHKKKGEKKERRFIPTAVKPGDRVVYGRYAGETYTIDGEERVLVRERDILGILPAPLQIPAATASAGKTALMKSVAQAPAGRLKAAKKTAAKKTDVKTVAKKTAVKKTKKAEKKATNKPVAKKKTTAAKSSKTTVTKRSAKGKKAGKKR
jgi:chaperonin GroES